MNIKAIDFITGRESHKLKRIQYCNARKLQVDTRDNSLVYAVKEGRPQILLPENTNNLDDLVAIAGSMRHDTSGTMAYACLISLGG